MTQKCTCNKAKNKIKLNHAKHVMNSKERKKVAEKSTMTKRETNGKIINVYPKIHLSVNGLNTQIERQNILEQIYEQDPIINYILSRKKTYIEYKC